MAEHALQIKPPEDIVLVVMGKAGQQFELPAGKFTLITFDYEGDTLIFEGKTIKQIATLKTISDMFWMILSLTAKGFEVKPNEPLEILKKVLSEGEKKEENKEK